MTAYISHCRHAGLSGCAALLLLLPAGALAEVQLDGSISGPAGILSATQGPTGENHYEITEQHGSQVGNNLFHSFSTFDIASGESATFSGQAGTQNVIGRVTGGGRSQIYGALNCSIPGANLYLINPAGMVFGEGASVSVDGAFYASTADYLTFAAGGDTERFEAASGGAQPLLHSAQPADFGFLGADRGRIVVAGAMELDSSVAHFVTGELLLQDGGKLETTNGGGIDIQANHLQMEGESEISSDVEGSSTGDAGDVTITVDTALLLGQDSRTPEISSDTEGTGNGGNIHITAHQSLIIRSEGSLPEEDDDLAGISTESKVDEGASPKPSGGDAGNITIQTAELRLDNGRIASGTSTKGQGGNIVIRGITTGMASTIVLSGEGRISSNTSATTSDAGDAGTIVLEAEEITLRGEAEISSDVGDGGVGKGGSISLLTDRLALLGEGGGTPEISADTAGSGDGGTISITASESVLIRSGEIAVEDDPGGDGESRAGIFTNSKLPNPQTPASGGASGTIIINAGRLEMDAGVIASDSATLGAAGGITIYAGRALRLKNNSEISVRSSNEASGAGDAGDVFALANVVDVRDSSINAYSEASDGGSVRVRATDYLLLRNSALTADVRQEKGGNLEVEAHNVVLDNSSLTATAGPGTGGAIYVAGRHYFSDRGVLNASANVSFDGIDGGEGPGIDGTVEVNAVEVDLTGSLTTLETEFPDASALLRSVCAARNSGQRLGSFTVVKNRGLPASAEGLPLFRPTAQAEQPRSRQLSSTARKAMRKRDWAQAAELLEQAETSWQAADGGYLLLHIARSWRLLASKADYRDAALRSAHALASRALELARSVDDARAESYALGNLAELYRVERRYREALYLASQALAAAERAEAPESIYRWHWLSGRLLWAEGRASEALQAYRRAVQILAETRQEALVSQRDGGFFRRSVAPVYVDLADALLKSTELVATPEMEQGLLREGRQVMEQFKAAELRDYFGDPCVAELEASERQLDEVSSSAAVVYPVPLRDRTELLISTPAGIQRFTAPVGRRKLEATARRFRVALQQSASEDYLPLAQQLYDWLLRPWLASVQQRGVDTLVFVPDGALRNIPMAALHDGQNFLIERVALAIAPGLDLVDPQPLQRDGLKLLMAGLSESVQGYPAIPKVADELAAVAALHGGEVLLNSDFSRARIAQSLAQNQPSIVHIASHAEFGGSPESSYLLTHDGRLSMAELGEVVGVARFRKQPLELLVLSACQTAVGDDRAALGLAGVALQAGARSVMGSLWSVSDEATYRLVENFYRALQSPELGKAAALREAQRQLLAQAEFSHPVYWAPFLLISNWL